MSTELKKGLLMKFAITDLTYDEQRIALAALNDAGISHAMPTDASQSAPTPVVQMTPAPVTETVQPGPATQPTSVTETAAPAALVDVKGTPWDARIHAKTQTKNADDTWRYKRGVAKTLIAEVEAELSAVAQPAEVPVDPNVVLGQPVASAGGVPDAAKLTADQIAGTPVQPTPPAPTPAPVQPTPPAPTPAGDDFAGLTTLLTSAIQNNTMLASEIEAMNIAFNMSGIQDLANDPVRIAQAVVYINTVIAQKAPVA